MGMTIFLPAKGQFETFERSLESDYINAIIERLTPDDVELYLPKFEFDASLNFAPTLEEMSMPDALGPARADFSGIDGTRNLFLAAAVHKAAVTVSTRWAQWLPLPRGCHGG